MKEDDFMASLLSSVTATTAEPARKRRSSPELPSSDAAAPSSDSSFFGGVKKRYGQESDDEDYSRRRNGAGKKARVSDMTIVPDENQPDYGGMDSDIGMEVDQPIVKEEVNSDDDDEIEIKPKTAPLLSAATKLNGQAGVRRKVVNSTSVKHVIPKPEPISVKAEADTPVKPRVNTELKSTPNGAAHWSAVQDSLVGQIKSSELDAVKAPVGSDDREQ